VEIVSGAKLVRVDRQSKIWILGRLLRLAACRFQLSNRLTLNHQVPGSSPGAPTIQSPQATLSRVDAKLGASAGISGHLLPGLWSLPVVHAFS